MIRISNIKLKPGHSEDDLYRAAAKHLLINADGIASVLPVKRSLDARRRPEIFYVYTVDVLLKNSASEAKILKKREGAGGVNISAAPDEKYIFPCTREDFACVRHKRPVVVGFGPAGMFAALMLARCGLRPLVIERGQCVEDRKKSVGHFWETGELDTQSNVQFGEGGAGTFSDGKLNTSVKDAAHRMKEVLRTFAEFGADSSVTYLNKPHIGTDVLCDVVKNIRNGILSLGADIMFNTCLEDLKLENGRIRALTVRDIRTGIVQNIDADCVILAPGHSARDTFAMLYRKNINMAAKAFAVGVRIEHPQSLIDMNAYGETKYDLPAADYKLTAQITDKKGFKRGVYSFCMCPGGYVVNASSENGMLAVNGMSFSGRDGCNANSAVIVTVTPGDYAGCTEDGTDIVSAAAFPDGYAGSDIADGRSAGVISPVHPLAGIGFQRRLERLAYRAGSGSVPVQLAADFKAGRESSGLGSVVPQIKGGYRLSDVRGALPGFIGDAVSESMSVFERYIRGFDMDDAVFSGVESRTSSPLRIIRDNDTYESNIAGLYPCGEGAGYAGGITSAAMDGIRAAEKAALHIAGRDK